MKPLARLKAKTRKETQCTAQKTDRREVRGKGGHGSCGLGTQHLDGAVRRASEGERVRAREGPWEKQDA